MPYSMKRKAIGAEEPLSCPFGQGGAGKKTPTNPQTLQDSLPPPPQYWFGAESGLFHSCHRRGCASPAFPHCPSAQRQHAAQGYGRRQNYFLLKPSFVSQLACSFHLQQHYAHDKEFGEKKKKKSLMNFLFKKNFKVFKIQGDLCLWHSLAPKFFL